MGLAGHFAFRIPLLFHSFGKNTAENNIFMKNIQLDLVLGVNLLRFAIGMLL